MMMRITDLKCVLCILICNAHVKNFFSKEESHSAQYSRVQYRLFGVKVWIVPQNVEKIDCLIKLAYRMNYCGIPF